MGAWAGPFLVAAALLAVAGALKAVDPVTTVGALRRSGLPAPPVVVRIAGVLEVAIAVVAVLTGAALPALLVAGSYLVFTVFVLFALTRHLPIGSCGCFGKVDTPPSVIHLAVNAGAVVSALAVALGPGAHLLRDLPQPPRLRHGQGQQRRRQRAVVAPLGHSRARHRQQRAPVAQA